MKSFADIVDCWPQDWELAYGLGVPEHRVRHWRANDSIPARYWRQLLRLAKKKGIPLTANKLIDLADKKR